MSGLKINRIYNESCLDTMAKMPDNCLHLTVTSPPYDNLRNYGGNALLPFPLFKQIAAELFRVTRKGGVVVWVVGDATIKGSETGTSFKQALWFKKMGFNLHDTMIYEKSNFANPSSNRYHQIFEFVFVLSKGKPATFNPIKDRPNACAGQTCWGANNHRQKDGSLKPDKKRICRDFGMRHNSWRINTGFGQIGDKIAHRHPAAFPEKLAQDHIISWSDPWNLVYDPFMGSGTTAKAAIVTNRHFIGSEINPEYCEIANKRIKTIKR